MDRVRAVHVVLKDIAHNVIKFMVSMKECVKMPLDMLKGVGAYMPQSYPMLLTLKVMLMVNPPKVAVTEIDGKGASLPLLTFPPTRSSHFIRSI